MSDGQTLIEMVIAIGLVAFVLVGLVAGATASLKTARLSRERNRAVQLAQTELEAARRERDADPDVFFGSAGTTGPTNSGTNPTYSITVVRTLVGSAMEVVVTVSWVDAGNTYTVTEETTLARWL